VLEAGEQRVPPAPRVAQRFGPERPGEGFAAEGSDERALLVREVDRLERERQLGPRPLHREQDVQRRDDPEGAVVATSRRDRVEVRAEEERRSARAEDRRMVAGGVDARREPCGLGSREEPRPGREMRSTEAGAVDPAGSGRADACERVEVLAQPLAVDANQYPRSTKRPRPGEPTKAPFWTITSPRLIVVTGSPRTVIPS